MESINLSNWLKNIYLDLDLTISSDAKRATQTSELVFKPLGKTFEKNFRFTYVPMKKFYKLLES